MNLVQLAEHAKNLSNQQLQMMLQRPDGMVPPFILAAEAARRQDIERSAMSQPAQPTTVLDDLIQSRTDKAGVSQLPGQMATPPAPQAMPPQAQQPQMRNGGQVRRFVGGGLSDLETGDPMGSGAEYAQGTGYGLADIYNFGKEAVAWTNPYYAGKQIGRYIGQSGIFDNVPPLIPRWEDANGYTADDKKAIDEDVASVQRRSGLARGVVPAASQRPTDPAATDKLIKTGETEKNMGANPTVATPPTTENASDQDKISESIKALFAEKDNNYILGISPTTYSAIAAAMLSRKPGLSSGERWAAASAALAAQQERDAEAATERADAGALALLKREETLDDRAYNERRDDVKYQREKADMDARYAQAAERQSRDNQIAGLKVYADSAKQQADMYQKQIDAILEPLMGNPPTDEATIKQIKDWEILRDSYRQIQSEYEKKLGSGVYGVQKIQMADPVTGRPLP